MDPMVHVRSGSRGQTPSLAPRAIFRCKEHVHPLVPEAGNPEASHRELMLAAREAEFPDSVLHRPDPLRLAVN